MFPPSRKYAPTDALAAEDVDVLDKIRKRLSFKPTLKTLQGWCTRGVINRFTLERIVLESIFLPQGRGTSTEAVQRFLIAINRVPAKDTPPRPRPITRAKTPAFRKKPPSCRKEKP